MTGTYTLSPPYSIFVRGFQANASCSRATDVLIVARTVNRGSRVVSRLANLYPDRFIAFGFLALGYLPPAPEQTFQEMSAKIKATLGRETFGYMPWYAADGTADVLVKNVRPFDTLLLGHGQDGLDFLGQVLTMTVW